MKKLLTATAAFASILTASCGTIQSTEQVQAFQHCSGKQFMSLSDDVRPECFRHAHQVFPSSRIEKGDWISEFSRSDKRLEFTYQYNGESFSLSDFAHRNLTTGILVAKGETILHEEYFLGADENSLFTSFSVGKSIVSTLVGLAIEDGYIDSIDDKLTKYLPHYSHSGYKDVTVKQALQMSSGVKFDEAYDVSGKVSEFSRLFNGAIIDRTASFSEVMSSLEGVHQPGSVFNYSSGESSVLSELVIAATGKSASSYLSEKIWSQIGMEKDAYWWVDKEGKEFGAGSLSISLRDYARFGLVMLNKGKFSGKRVLSEAWVDEATTADADHLQPGQLYEGFPLGYQYQWWTFPGGESHPYSALGVYGQYVYVNPASELVVVITSAWPEPENPQRDAETFALFAAIEHSIE
jgi:CubicO group peptidase (beta-lactamase class C family)